MVKPLDGQDRKLGAWGHTLWGTVRTVSESVVWGVMLAVMGPFNTYGLGSFWQRFLYWGPLILVSLLLVRYIKPRVITRFPNRKVTQEFVTTAFFLVIFLPILVVWNTFGFRVHAHSMSDIGTLVLFVCVICVSIILAQHLIPHLFSRGPVIAETEDKITRPRLLRRLPDGFSGSVLRLSGDGHYVKVSTTAGLHEIRLRLRDAVDEMHGVPGFWSHRSHWVATEAIADWTMRKGRPILVLSNGDEVPVGAKYQPDLEVAGFVFDRGIVKEKA